MEPPASMAPEQRAGMAGLSCDIFAFGVILHELLTGRPLFLGHTFEEVLRIQQEEDYRLRPARYRKVLADPGETRPCPRALDLEVILGGALPARRILEALLNRVRLLVEPTGSAVPSVADLESEPSRLADLMEILRARSRKTLVLVVDQEEEVFTLNEPASPAAVSFFELVGSIVHGQGGTSPVKIVLAARTEFRGDLFPLEQRLGSRIQIFPVREIEEPGLREAIEGPTRIEAYQFSYEPDLPGRMVRDILTTSR